LIETGFNMVFRNITWLESCTFLQYCTQCMVVLSDGTYCPRVLHFCILYGQCPLQISFSSVFLLHYVRSYESCLWPSVGGVAVYNEQTKSISFHFEHHIWRNVKLFHHPQLSHWREVHSLLNGSNEIVCCRTAQMYWNLCLVCALRHVWQFLM